MTGFARAGGHDGDFSWTWEVKSVNGRGLELRCRLPGGMEALEAPARQLAAAKLRRGNVNINLQVSRAAGVSAYRLNHGLLRQLADIVREAEGVIDGAAPRIDGLLGLKGVLETIEPEESEEAREAREQAMLRSLAEAVAGLVAARAAEGSRLSAILREQIGDMARLTEQAAVCAALRPEAIKQRLKDQVAALLEASPALSEDRLAQEAAILVAKADIREELDRLRAHVAAAGDLLNSGGDAGGAGRRLDFLSQEFNREANTLCSKSGDVDLTRIGLDLKLVIDRFREQVQNIE